MNILLFIITILLCVFICLLILMQPGEMHDSGQSTMYKKKTNTNFITKCTWCACIFFLAFVLFLHFLAKYNKQKPNISLNTTITNGDLLTPNTSNPSTKTPGDEDDATLERILKTIK